MITITSYSIIQAIVFVICILMASIVILFGSDRLKKPLVVFLIASALWSFISFMSNQPLPFEQAVLWGRFVALAGVFTSITYGYFICFYTNNRRGKRLVLWLGVTALLVVGVLVILGQVPQEFVPRGNGILYKQYGNIQPLLTASGTAFLIIALTVLIKKYRSNINPEERNRIGFLLLGIGILIIAGIIFTLRPQQKYTVDQVGHLLNSVVVTYVVLRHRLINLQLFIRRGFVYFGITLAIMAAFAMVIFVFNNIMQDMMEDPLSTPLGIAILIVLIIAMAVFFNPLRIFLEKGAERAIYGRRYDYRKMIKGFSDKMRNVIEIEELADAMLRPIAKAISTVQATLLMKNDNQYTASFAERLDPEESPIPISLKADSQIITYLETTGRPLYRQTIYGTPEFKGIWQEDKNNLDSAEVELLLPIVSKDKLIGILAISEKAKGRYYTQDDVDLLMTLADEAAVVIENARLYSKAKERANTDELTGLYNHRYFHERLGKEIARCSRFGDIFSLIFLDMDQFKNYNDVQGHLFGDKVLQKLGNIIKQTIRVIDIGCRYGGDEFAVLLPETSLEGASKVAERIRKSIEADTGMKGIPQTVSIGIASWPTDGLMRDEIISSADAALYHAKQMGGNRVSLACEVALSDILRLEKAQESNSKRAILSTIYALAATVDAKDHYTYGHSKKVCMYAVDIAKEIGYSDENIDRVRAAALLHDIGKIGIPDYILKKRETLTEDEWQLVHAHPNLGVSILKHVESLNGCLAGVQYHHERYDGTGYPAGLKGENIPLDARILAVADSYDAMTSERPYRKKSSPEEAMTELLYCSGTQFDPAIVNAFLKLMKDEIKTNYQEAPTN